MVSVDLGASWTVRRVREVDLEWIKRSLAHSEYQIAAGGPAKQAGQTDVTPGSKGHCGVKLFWACLGCHRVDTSTYTTRLVSRWVTELGRRRALADQMSWSAPQSSTRRSARELTFFLPSFPSPLPQTYHLDDDHPPLRPAHTKAGFVLYRPLPVLARFSPAVLLGA